MPTSKGSIRLFQFLGINVYLHWSWFIVPFFLTSYVGSASGSYVWAAWQCLFLFAMVLMHEFGHSLACRSVGGKADEIVLWPLGGVAYVSPPWRPGAMLWSIAAGPLVNVLLAPILFVATLVSARSGADQQIIELLTNTLTIDIGLLCFNMLPVYPLDGGKIVQSLLWYWLGFARSLKVASILGFVTVGVLLLFSIRSQWMVMMAVFALFQCWGGLQYAREFAKIEEAGRHVGLACPSCGEAPPMGKFWGCGKCRQPFDMFGNHGVCPSCGTRFEMVRCIMCGQMHPVHAFVRSYETPAPGA